jgi:hypothetical protein
MGRKLLKSQRVSILGTTIQLCYYSKKAAIAHMKANEHEAVPTKLYLLKHVEGYLWSMGHSLPSTTTIDDVEQLFRTKALISLGTGNCGG